MKMKKKISILMTLLMICSVLLVFPGPVLALDALELIKPNGGETVLVGASYTVTWTGGIATEEMTVSLSLDSGATYDIYLGVGTGGSFTFNIPDTPTANARIRVSGVVGYFWIHGNPVPLEGSDESNADFTILKMHMLGPLFPIQPIQPVIPNAPTELRTVSVSGSSVQLAWKDNSAIETGFRLFRRQQEAMTWTQLAELPANQIAYTDNGPFVAGSRYDYRVLAFSSAGASGYSNEIIVNIPLLIEPPLPVPDPVPVGEPIVIRLKIGSRSFTVDGAVREMDTAPMIIGGRTLLPIRYVADPLGAALGWNNADSKATVQMGGTLLELWIGNNQARVNGSNRYIDPGNHSIVPIIVPPGRTMLPLRFIAESLGCDVVWNPGDQSVTVTYVQP